MKGPNTETSIEIIKLYKNKINNTIVIDGEVYLFIDKKFSKNISELKGITNKLLFLNINMNIKKIIISF